MAVAGEPSVKRAAVYVRVSSAKQEDNFSLPSQEQACRGHAAERGYAVNEAHIYREVFSAADIWDRPELSRLRSAIEAGALDVVIVYEPKRLSRDPDDGIFLAVEARRRGVHYEFVTRPPDNSPYAGLIRYLDGLHGKNERDDIIERASRGRRARAESGLPLPGWKAPYGYRWKPDVVLEGRKRRTPKPGLEEDPETSWVVRRIWAEAAEGHGQLKIAEGLTRDGIPTPTGRSSVWREGTVRHILMNSLYVGQPMAFRVRVYKDAQRQTKHRKVVEARPLEEQVPLPELVAPPLVDAVTFAAVQERRQLNKRQARRAKREPARTLLNGGYARCGYCGRTMFVHRHRDRLSYRCIGRQRHRDCIGATIVVDALDCPTWARVEGLLVDPGLIKAELERLERQDPTDDVEAVDRDIAQVERTRRNLIGNLGLLDVESAADVRERLASLGERLQELRERRASFFAQQETRRHARGQLAELERWCRTVAANVRDLGYEQRRMALDAFGVRVRVWRPDHNPRFTIEASIPLNGATKVSTSRSAGGARTTTPESRMPRTPTA